MHEATQRSAALERSYEELVAQNQQLQESFQQSQQPQYQSNDYRERLAEMFENDPVDTMTRLAQEVADNRIAQFQKTNQEQFQPYQQAAENVVAMQATNALEARYGAEWQKYAPKVGEWISENASYLEGKQTDPSKLSSALDNVFKMVRADDVLAGNIDPGQQQENLMTAMKLNAQSSVGASGRPAQPEEDYWARIQSAGGKTDGRYWK